MEYGDMVRVSCRVRDKNFAFYLLPRGAWIDMVSSSASSLLTAAIIVKSSPPPKSISTSGTMADWLLSPRTLATLPCEKISNGKKEQKCHASHLHRNGSGLGSSAKCQRQICMVMPKSHRLNGGCGVRRCCWPLCRMLCSYSSYLRR